MLLQNKNYNKSAEDKFCLLFFLLSKKSRLSFSVLILFRSMVAYNYKIKLIKIFKYKIYKNKIK